MFTRRIVAAATAALGVLAVAPLPHARADSPAVNILLRPAWATADLAIVRHGWTVTVNGHLTDTRDDGDCVYVEAVLEVDDWMDPDTRIPDQCANRGSRIFVELPPLTPGFGSRLAQIRVRVCAADALKDSCQERTLPVPADRATRPDLKAQVDASMNMSMDDFLRTRAGRPGAFDWTSDGCSMSPDTPNGWNFKDACYRHDFGYRNYGEGAIKASPIDATRAQVDLRLRSDLMDVCAEVRERRRCEALATIYYGAVRKGAGKAFYS